MEEARNNFKKSFVMYRDSGQETDERIENKKRLMEAYKEWEEDNTVNEKETWEGILKLEKELDMRR